MSFTSYKILGAIGVLSALAAGQANAQTAASSDEQKTANLQQRIDALEQKLKSVENRSFANANAGYIPKKAVPFPDVTVKMPGNRPTICTADGYNCIAITSRLHFDYASYNYRPNTAATTPQFLADGVNARRARVGVMGTFARDWDFGLILDGGGTTDGAASLNQAYISYRGFRSFANLTIEGGYIDVPYTLDEATSSNNIMFLERSSANVIATSLNAGDSRSAFGAHINDNWWWAGAYVTGPTTGTAVNHSQRQPLGATGRAVIVPINNQTGSLLLGADVAYLGSTGGAFNGVDTVTLSDRIEVRVDPGSNALLSTGALGAGLVNVESAQVTSAEAAVSIGSFYAQGEYYDYHIARSGASDLNFSGYYGQASYVLTGESRKYNASTGAYGGINPKNPAQSGTGGYGAWEVAGRYSYVDLNDINGGAAANNVRGGTLRNTTLGVNWYATQNIRFMFNWINGQVEKRNAANVDLGAKYDVFALRTQFAF